MDNAINFSSFNTRGLSVKAGLLYYIHYCGKDLQWCLDSGNKKENLEKADNLFVAELKALIKLNKYTVFIAATNQIPWIEAHIAQYSMEDWVFYRQPEACFNAGYEEEGRLRTYIFKEPV